MTNTPAASPVAKATGSTPGLIRTFLLDHERLIVIVLVLAFTVWGYHKYADIRAQHDSVVLQQAKLASDAQAKVVAAQAMQAAQDKQDLQALQAKVDAQSAQIAQQNATLVAALAARQKTDASLPLPDLAARWTVLVPTAVPVATAQGVTVAPAGAVATVQALEQIQPLKEELKNETTLKTNDDQLITQQNKSIFDLNTSITGLNAKSVTDKNQCEAEKKVIKDEAKKTAHRWGKFGFIAGFFVRQFIKTETGW